MSEFAVVLSKEREKEAVREISLKIKYSFPWSIDLVLVFFTPHYRVSSLLSSFFDTLTPNYIVGIRTPWIIYEDRIIPQGVMVISLSLPGASFYLNVIERNNFDKIEVSLRNLLRETSLSFLFAFLPPSINQESFLKELKIALGKSENFLGCVSLFSEESGDFFYQFLDGKIVEGILFLGLDRNVNVHHKKISGFTPVGRPFVFTKIDRKRRLILEIDNQPAFDIYRKYLEEKIEIFKERNLFYLYPLGVKKDISYRLISIQKLLENESFTFIGNIEEGMQGNIMILKEKVLWEEIENFFKEEKVFSSSKLVIAIESSLREKILKEKLREELSLIKKNLGNVPLVGFYSRYHLEFDTYFRDFVFEEGNLHLISLR